MDRISIKCLDCGKRKWVIKKHKKIVGKQCIECLRLEHEKEVHMDRYNENFI